MSCRPSLVETLAYTESFHNARTLLLSAAAIVLVIGMVLGIFLARGFSIPLGQAVATLEQVADGDLTRIARCAHQGRGNRSGTTLQGIVGSVKRVTGIVGEIAAASAEQSTGVDQVNSAITRMDQVTQSNSAQTEELSATAQNLSAQATGSWNWLALSLCGTAATPRAASAGISLRAKCPHSTASARQPGNTTNVAGKTPPSAPSGRKQVNPAAVLAAAAGSDEAALKNSR